MYKKIDGGLNCYKNEQEIQKFWTEHGIKEKCLNRNKGAKIFSFYEGPPTANGVPHNGHVFTRALKDMFVRFRAMQGYYVPRKGGWDTHGLPVELSVEKSLGISGKAQIEEYGVTKFIEKCKADVWKYVDQWKDFSDKVGYSVDMGDNAYVTYHNDYIESIWWAISEIDKKGWIYKGFKVLPSCPSCGTALSSHEVAQGYKDRKDTTVVAKFKALDFENTYFLAWTTTPWTLPSNIALCVNPNEKYVMILSEGVNYILAEALVPTHFKDKEFEVVKHFVGTDLEYKKYEPLFDFVSEKDKAKGYFVTCDEYVTLTDGTGIVHIAPAYGEDDAKVGRKYDLPLVQMANKYGKFESNCGEWAGKDVFEENENIALALIKDGKIFKTQKHVHSYPHCWRCDSPLMYFARSGWFMKTTEIRDNMVKNNNSVNWLPENVKDGRMGNFLANNIDWCLSRDRYWGTPLPIWTCECGHKHVVGSVAELKKLAGIPENQEVELHKPYVDEITFKCSECGGTMQRVPEVLDCWFDSGSMPFAQYHYPFENKEIFDKAFPADFISEGVDQTRGWFYSLQAISSALFDKSPYRTCIANGMLVDENGKKLSKHLGNYTPPIEMIESLGADPLRWTLYTATQPWNNIICTKDTVKESIKKFFGTLWNTYAFYVMYAEIDKFDPSKFALKDCKLSIMDKWILSELNILVEEVTKLLEEYASTESARIIQDFVDRLSNWYVRCGRKRYWGSDFSEDKKAAYVTLYTVLSTLSKLIAPFTPFIAEEIYQNIERPFFENAKESIHLCDYPLVDRAYIDKTLSNDMNLAYAYTELGRSARNLASIKNRQPLSTLYLTEANNKTNLGVELLNTIKEELNVKNIIQNQNLDEFVNYSLKPQLKTLGPKYGKNINGIREYLANCDVPALLNEIKANGTAAFEVNGEEVKISQEDLLITVNQKEGYISSVDNNLAVVLDTHITKELKEEGIVREFISRVQNLRKSSGLDIVDRIAIEVDGDSELVNIILGYTETILGAVLAVSVKAGNKGSFNETIEFDEKNVSVYITKAN